MSGTNGASTYDKQGPLASPLAERSELDNILGGPIDPPTDDIAFQPPKDPLAGGEERAKIIYRDLPLTSIQTTWTVSQVQQALAAHSIGLFDQSAQLVDAIVGDDRVQASLGSRTGGLFGREVKFTAGNDSDAAKECRDAWAKSWSRIAPEPVLKEIQQWAVNLGFSPAQTVWDTESELWTPYLRPWHPRYVYYHWQFRTYVAITQDGQVPIVPGNGKWFLHAPNGEYRGWMRGSVRALARPWMIRDFAYRDWARYSERHGMPIIKAIVPSSGDKDMRAQFIAQVSSIGQETAIMLPKNVDGTVGYDLDLLEAKDQSWESFGRLIDRCDASIVLTLLFQNLTTEVKEGSFAAARVHGDVRQGALASDNAALKLSIYTQLARPFAAFNFGDPDLAPWTEWDVTPIEDVREYADLFQKFGTAVEVLRRGGVQFESAEEVKKLALSFGLKLPSVKLVEPVSGGMGGGK